MTCWIFIVFVLGVEVFKWQAFRLAVASYRGRYGGTQWLDGFGLDNPAQKWMIYGVPLLVPLF